MMLGMMSSRTSLMPRSLTTPGGVRFLDPAHHVSQEELDKQDRRWRQMRERAWARAAAQACLNGVQVNVNSISGRNGSSGQSGQHSGPRSSSASMRSGSSSWNDDAATLVGSVRYYAGATSAVRGWTDRNSIRSTSRRRRRRDESARSMEASSDSRSYSVRSAITDGGEASVDAADGDVVNELSGETAASVNDMRRGLTQSSDSSAGYGGRSLDDADPFSANAGNVFRRTTAVMTARYSTSAVRPQNLQPPQQSGPLQRVRSADSASPSNHAERRLLTTARDSIATFPRAHRREASISSSTGEQRGSGTNSHGAARLAAVRLQMRRRKLSEALQRLLGGVRV